MILNWLPNSVLLVSLYKRAVWIQSTGIGQTSCEGQHRNLQAEKDPPAVAQREAWSKFSSTTFSRKEILTTKTTLFIS